MWEKWGRHIWGKQGLKQKNEFNFWHVQEKWEAHRAASGAAHRLARLLARADAGRVLGARERMLHVRVGDENDHVRIVERNLLSLEGGSPGGKKKGRGELAQS